MLVLDQVYLDYENGNMAIVRCAACGEELGHVQVEPQNAEDDPFEWEEKVQGEIDVLRAEHQKECCYEDVTQ